MDAGSVADHNSFFSLLYDALGFPTDFGHNWNALDDSLWDPDAPFLAPEGTVLVVRNARHLWSDFIEIAGLFFECWVWAAQKWARSSTPFHLVFII